MLESEKHILPMVAMRGLVALPGSTINFDIGRIKSVRAIEEAIAKTSNIFLTAQVNTLSEDPAPEEIFKIGIIAKIRQIIRMPGNMLRVMADTHERGIITGFIENSEYFIVDVEIIKTREMPNDNDHVAGLIRNTHVFFEEYAGLYGKLMPDAIMEVLSCESVGRLADLIGIHANLKFDEKQLLLQELDDYKRLILATQMLNKEISILTVQREIYTKVKSNIDKHQKDYFLREQIKVIQEEIGDKDGIGAEIAAYRQRIEKEKLPEYAVEKLEKELKRLERITSYSPEATVIRDYIENVLELPWSKKTKDRNDLKKAKIILDKEHYGLDKPKERVLEFLAARQVGSRLEAPILCLVGSPGVGKTSIAKSVAKALGREYVRMSLGGVRDEADIRGHRKTYIGAMPGRIIYAVKQAKTQNPLILLDEIDKMNSDFRGNPAAALLEVLDAEQNNSFRDHYIELPYDLSDVMFICTANTIETIPPALMDRLEIIKLESYTEDEKLNIATKFLIDKQFKKHGLKRSLCKIKDDAILDIVRYYTKEAGVRKLEQQIGSICRKVIKARLMGDSKSLVISSVNLEEYLGKRKYQADKINDMPEIGIVRGLAWTALGGDTLSVEVNVMKGNGKFELTGSMGDVMKESAKAAMSYIRSKHEEFKLDKNFYRINDVHIHIPEGAVPKDGPSAGITMATAMVSAFTQVPIRNDIGMTGEVTIRGRVLPIGGLKEKTLAAKNAGLKKIILPKENERDLVELSDYIKTGLEFVLVKDMQEVLEHSLVWER